MTTEEKAKAYDEAIERAKSKIRNDKDHVLYEEDILDIFPSLKESDEERIRKEIIEDYRCAKRLCREGEEGSKRILDEKIAWLEKHGERPNNVYDEYLSDNLGCVIRRYINDPSIPDAVREMVKREIIPYVERLEKQDMQNTWKPSESDIRILEQVIDGTANPINYHATLHAILEKLKKLREK